MRNRIKIIKNALLASALALTGFLFFWSEGTDNRVVIEAPEVETKKINTRASASTEMLSPRFIGEDGKNRRWEVTADKAIQKQNGDIESVFLEKIKARATMEGGEEIQFTSNKGAFNRLSSTLDLDGDVHFRGYGYVLKTEQLTGNMDSRYMASNTKVTINGPTGNLVGGKLELLNAGQTLKLTNGVRAKIWPNKVKGE